MSFHHHHSSCCHGCTTSSCCCCCSPSSRVAAPISSNNSEYQQLLQALTTHLLIQSQPQPQPQHVFIKTQHRSNNSNLRPHHQSKDDGPSLLLLNSLFRRVTALESSLSDLSSSPPPTPRKKQMPSSQPHSIKHLAAETIQRHFRRFLVRRSRTLRDLKHLASIKSCAATLRSDLSDKSLKNPRVLSQKATDLLFQLDTIQSSDPMIREGKRAISRELVRISEFIEKVLLREREDEVDELERRRDKGRRVSFVENGDDTKMFDDLPERISREEETQLRDRGFFERFSDGEESREVTRHDRVNGGFRGLNRRFGLAAPLPVKMEPIRGGSMKEVVIEED